MSACGQGAGNFAQSHTPTGAKTVFVAIGGSEFAGPSVSGGGHQDWTQLFFARDLSGRSTLYEMSAPDGSYVEDLLSGELSQALALHPDLVAVWVGLPDLLGGMPAASFEYDLQQVLTRLDSAHARVLVANLLPIYRFSDYATCQPEPAACGLSAGELPPSAQLATEVSSYDQAVSAAASGHRASVVNLTAAFTSHLGTGGPAAPSALVDRTDLGLTAAGEQLVAETFESAYSASRRS